ncbi:MAG: hypothetical protein J1E43_12005, partial [Christensenellaceae bacterium]|nr:hypothetical protein [Christensenellaceae bacterium]
MVHSAAFHPYSTRPSYFNEKYTKKSICALYGLSIQAYNVQESRATPLILCTFSNKEEPVMKKLFAMVLALTLALSMCAFASAED